MKKILLIPDSFKGTMSSSTICGIMERSIKRHYPEAEVIQIPVADGGEGSVDSFLTAMGGRKVTLEVNGPYFEKMEGFYGIVNGDTAIIEMAACAGLPLVGDDKRPDQTTTYGVGELIAHAAKNGCRKIIVGLGGSATNDAGAGAAAAIGVKFLDSAGKSFIPTGGTLSQVAQIDMSRRMTELDGLVSSPCVISTIFRRENWSCACVWTSEGRRSRDGPIFDSQLRALSQTILQQLGVDIAEVPGAGAAGGMGGGMVAFFGSRLQMGIEVVLDTVGFDQLLEHTDMVFTGEGKIDTQSLRGKVVIGVARRTKRKGVPLVAVVGDIGDNVEGAYDEGVSAIFSINRVAKDFKQVMRGRRRTWSSLWTI